MEVAHAIFFVNKSPILGRRGVDPDVKAQDVRFQLDLKDMA